MAIAVWPERRMATSTSFANPDTTPPQINELPRKVQLADAFGAGGGGQGLRFAPLAANRSAINFPKGKGG